MESLTSVHVEIKPNHDPIVRGYRGSASFWLHSRFSFVCVVHREDNESAEIKGALGWLGDGPRARLSSMMFILATITLRLGIVRFWFDRNFGIPLAKKVGDRYLIEVINGH